MFVSPYEQAISKVEDTRRKSKKPQRYSSENSRRSRDENCPNCPNCKKYNNCSRYNHFVAVCRSSRKKDWPRNNRQSGSYRATKKRTVKRTTETDLDSEDSSDEEFLAKSVVHMRIKMVKKHMG